MQVENREQMLREKTTVKRVHLSDCQGLIIDNDNWL
jgi:hypothetical protein